MSDKKKKKAKSASSYNFTALFALLGVIIGGLITGYFANKSHSELLEYQKEQFLNEHKINKNQDIRKEVEEFIDDLSTLLIIEDNLTQKEKDNLYSRMYSNSLKMSLLRDLSIGSNSLDLTLELRGKPGKINSHDTITHKLIRDWIMAVKSEMLLSDYSIDKSELANDLIQIMLNSDK